MEFHIEKKMEEGDRGDQEENRGVKRRETNLACISSLSVLHSPAHPERSTELYREEKREEGDRGDQEEKRGSQKGTDKSSQ